MIATLVRHDGTEDEIVESAMVLAPHERHNKTPRRFLAKIMRLRHGTPFEDVTLKWYVEAPLFTIAQWHRHRIGWSYSVASQRYKNSVQRSWEPDQLRPLKEVENFNPMAPEFEHDANLTEFAILQLRAGFADCWGRYEAMRRAGIANEVARAVLPTSTYTAMYARCNLRSFLHFASLRLSGGNFPSHPQWEIEHLTLSMVDQLAKMYPHTINAFYDNGKVSP